MQTVSGARRERRKGRILVQVQSAQYDQGQIVALQDLDVGGEVAVIEILLRLIARLFEIEKRRVLSIDAEATGASIKRRGTEADDGGDGEDDDEARNHCPAALDQDVVVKPQGRVLRRYIFIDLKT